MVIATRIMSRAETQGRGVAKTIAVFCHPSSDLCVSARVDFGSGRRPGWAICGFFFGCLVYFVVSKIALYSFVGVALQ
jgi:hypothetical protein